jgi:Rps23 Pro-64 3,4-dihydroxylase Tpa1-like proline 4-hydroxylase
LTALPPIRMRSELDRESIRAVFARVGRAHISELFTAETAQAIYTTLAQATKWQLSMNSGERHMDVTADDIDGLPEPQRTQLRESIHRGARAGFQYLFNNFPIHDIYTAGLQRDHYLMRVYEFLNSDDFLDFARYVTGMPDIVFVDAQATLYRPGHFLTEHDDAVEGKDRRAAYVLSFTRGWKPTWGGILEFIDSDGHVAEGYTPKFNALNLMRVPQKHAVSYVVPWAAEGRYSITGWLRASREAPNP